MAVIEVEGLTKRFSNLVAVDHVSFTVEQGNIVGFLGPNGAGKTTTLRMVLDLVAPTEGTATINGRRYRDLPRPLNVVGAALESSNAYPGRTARNHLRIEALVGRASPARVDEVLDLVDLTDAADRRVGKFSLGMRQRLSLATALLCDPEILILDEPANGLDPEGVHWLRQLLRRLASGGRTVLVSSHILAEVAQTVDSVVILDHGRLIESVVPAPKTWPPRWLGKALRSHLLVPIGSKSPVRATSRSGLLRPSGPSPFSKASSKPLTSKTSSSV
jgi:ABC-2 type transport system ATP-binding protein